MTIEPHDHDSTDTKMLSPRLVARLGLAVAVLVATTAAGVGPAVALPGEAEQPAVDGRSTAAPSVKQVGDSKATPGTVIQSGVVGINEEYIAVKVQFPDDVFVGEKQFPDDVFAGGDAPDFPSGTTEISSLPFEHTVYTNDMAVERRGSLDETQGVSDTDALTVSDLAYLAPADEIKPAKDGEMPILTPVTMDFENPHEVTVYFQMEDGWPKEYLSGPSAGGPLGIHMIAPGGWHALPSSQAAVAGPSPTQIPGGAGTQEQATVDSRPETGTDADLGGGPLTTPQDRIPVPGGMP